MRAAVLRFLSSSNLLRPWQGSAYDRLPANDRDDAYTASTTKSPRFFNVASLRLPSTSRFASSVSPRYRLSKLSCRILTLVILVLLIGGLIGGRHLRRYHHNPTGQGDDLVAEWAAKERHWDRFPGLSGFFNGVRDLVSWDEFEPDEQQAQAWGNISIAKKSSIMKRQWPARPRIPLKLQVHHPYPDYKSPDYLRDYYPVHTCYLDANESQKTPDVFVFPGVPQHMTLPFFGSYQELGLRHDVCYERFGRLGPYGYGYPPELGGLGLGLDSDASGSELMWDVQPPVNYSVIDWGTAQKTCYEKNNKRFLSSKELESMSEKTIAKLEKRKLPRQAFVLRTWTGFEYTPHEVAALRAFINELSLKSGGEYDVHLLLHVKDDTIPIWSSKEVYRMTIQDNVPREFWGITTLWSVQLMRMYYPGPFGEPYANIAGQEIWGVYRSAHFALQWFAQEHPEYDYIWNWEMDVRYSGHNYEFHQGVAGWARDQPRKGLWERNAKMWIPAHHGTFKNFTNMVDAEIKDSETEPIWGPIPFPNHGGLQPPPETTPPHSYDKDNFEWGVGEEADLITFDPIFDPAASNWIFRHDISGYDLNQEIPPRRCAIITIARLSRRLLNIMHEETYITKHSAFPEMWPPTVALHHGLKAVYIPHPVYFDRNWELGEMNQVFNYPKDSINSPFGWGEHNWLGSSFYYNSGFSGLLWRRWLGEKENGEGGNDFEKHGSGRMCLRATLHHPIKNENLPTE